MKTTLVERAQEIADRMGRPVWVRYKLDKIGRKRFHCIDIKEPWLPKGGPWELFKVEPRQEAG